MTVEQTDAEFGESQEDLYLKLFSDFFNDTLNKATNKYSPWDYKGENYYYELKSRKCLSSTYPTTLIGADKFIKGLKQIFIFNFLDKILYIEKEELPTLETKKFKRTGNYVRKDYYFIPLSCLKILKTK